MLVDYAYTPVKFVHGGSCVGYHHPRPYTTPNKYAKHVKSYTSKIDVETADMTPVANLVKKTKHE